MHENLRPDDLPLEDAARVRYLVAACKSLEQEQFPTQHFAEMAAALTLRLAGLSGAAARPVSAKSMERYYYNWKGGKKDKRGRRVTAPRCWQAVFDGRTVAANRQQVRTAQPCFRAHLALLAGRHPRSLTNRHSGALCRVAAGQGNPRLRGHEPHRARALPRRVEQGAALPPDA